MPVSSSGDARLLTARCPSPYSEIPVSSQRDARLLTARCLSPHSEMPVSYVTPFQAEDFSLAKVCSNCFILRSLY
jgi:hypothetical protein